MTVYRTSNKRLKLLERSRQLKNSLRFLLSVLASAVISFVACTEPPPRGYEWLVSGTPESAEQQFKQLDAERQLEAYLYAAKHIHPPRRGYADIISRHGSSAIPVVVERLRRAKEDGEKERLIYIFARMEALGTAEIADDKALLNELQRIKASIEDPFHRRMADRSIAEITRHNSKASPRV